jgi:hypothetical protein
MCSLGALMYGTVFTSLESPQQAHRSLLTQALHTLLTNLTPWSWIFLEKQLVAHLLTNFRTFYGTRKFIAMLIRALYRSLYWDRLIQSIPRHLISLSYILILSFHLCIHFTNDLPFGFPIKIVCSFLSFPHSCYMRCPSHPSWLGFCNYVWQRIQIMKAKCSKYIFRIVTRLLNE